MKKKYIIIISIVFVSFFSFYSLFIDISDTKYFSFVEPKKVQLNNYVYYKYNNYVFLKDFNSISKKNDLQFLNKLIKNNDIIFIVEFSDFDKYFSKIKNETALDLNKFKYCHYIKVKEIEKYDDEIIVQRFHRALKERRIKVFWIPNTLRKDELTLKIKNNLKYEKPINDLSYFSPNHLIKYIFFLLIFFNIYIYLPFFSIIYLISLLLFKSWSYVTAATIFSFIVYYKISKKNVLKVVFSSIFFGIMVYFSGYDYLLINKLNSLRGIKVLLIALLSFEIINQLKNFKLKNLKKFDLITILLIMFFSIIYILRSGNWSYVSNFERKMRDIIEKIFIARPRTKELLSYPFYYLNNTGIIVSFFRTLLIVSILDTFLHFHTPLYLGILRTLNGLFIYLFTFFVFELIKYFRGGK
ncbi:hypothetical protein OSSY52_01340 [Tepiditoga spiralis]|uniref:Uncharacterized protein n=1 Tax=Tepiditoga spiralis TaxID=2108365 RepID=A0A7G1G5D1_9BACT|nr:DUF5693 family protein [Tepiditoga spiralis]BBE29993.1 hypothetical protein OSSY52_01340 [Tepiditoga spiralis]